ncbi:MAG: hypothetical protein U0905_14005 [Pirellulales bacterium]
MLSVPNLVEECAQAFTVGYDVKSWQHLQILALPDPTIANGQWNEWNTNQINRMSAPLLNVRLVEAKRNGREDLFLPGGWEPLKAPTCPFEMSWKLPLFG